MKNLLKFLLIFCLLVEIAQAQSPQTINFVSSGFTNSENLTLGGNTLWFLEAGTLMKLDLNTYAQTIYKPSNTDMKGTIQGHIVADSATGMVYGTSSYKAFFTFDGTHFQYYDTLNSGENIISTSEFQIATNGNVYMTAFLGIDITGVATYDIICFNGSSLSRLFLPYSNSFGFIIDSTDNVLARVGNNGKIISHNGGNWDSVGIIAGGGKLIKDKAQNIWCVPIFFSSNTSSYSFYKWNGNSTTTYNVGFNGAIDEMIKTITFDPNGNILFCGHNNIIIEIANNLYNLGSPPNCAYNGMNGLAGFLVTPNGDYWCRSYQYKEKDKIWHYGMNTATWESTQIFSDVSGGINNIQIDKWGRKWGLGHDNVFRLDGNTWENIPFPPNYMIHMSLNIKQLFFDTNGNLMMVLENMLTNGLTVWKHDGQNWSLLYNLLYNANYLAINELGQVALINSFGLCFFDGNTWTYPSLPAGVSPADILVEGQSFIFISGGDVIKFDGTNVTAMGNINTSVERISKDKLGNLWFFNGLQNNVLYKYDGNTVTGFDTTMLPFDFGPDSGIWGGATDYNGNIWMNTTEGLAKFDGTNWTACNIENTDFLGNSLGQMEIDNANNIWLTDCGGITVFNENGVPSNFTQSITQMLKGNFYYDGNANGVRDTNEYGLANQKALILPNNVFSISNSYGSYLFPSDTGSYNLSASLYPNWQQTSSPLNYIVSANPQGVDSLDFGIKTSVNIDSLELHIWNSGSHCNWENTYFISYKNKGNTSLLGDIIFTMDSLETFVSASQTADSLSPFVYSWHFSNLQPFQSQNVSVIAQSPNWQAIGQIINGNAQVVGGNVNVNTSYSNVLFCAYDPNDKTSKPLGEHYLHQIKPDCPLEYLIRFQNTGNDVAFNIAVEDTISSYLDMNTFELLGASHFVETKYTQNGAVRFEFPLIMLPDSNQNEALSHGFVAYRIKPKANVPLPAVIANTAFIYFDQNPAVVTNTARDTMTQFYVGINAPAPQNALLISPNPFDNQTIVSYPNPSGEGYEVLIYDLSGKLLLRKMDNTGRFSIEKGNLQSGMYLLKVKGRKEMSAKLVVE